QIKKCAPTLRKAPVETAVRTEYTCAKIHAVVHTHSHFSNLISGGSHHHEPTSPTRPASEIIGVTPPPPTIATYANPIIRYVAALCATANLTRPSPSARSAGSRPARRAAGRARSRRAAGRSETS